MIVLAFLGVLQVAAGQTIYPWQTAVSILDWTSMAATGWMAYQFSANPGFDRLFRNFLIVIGFIGAALSVLHWSTSIGFILWSWPNPYQAQTTFPLLNHSHFAALAELAVAPAIWGALQRDKGRQIYLWVASGLICAVWLVGSRSGSAIISLELVGVLVLGVRLLPARRLVRRRAVLIAAAVVLLTGAIGWYGVVARSAAAPDDSLRPMFARATWNMIKARPVLGFGLGTWADVYPAYESKDIGLNVEHAHNDWLEWAAEGGPLFVLTLAGLATVSFGVALRKPWFLGISAVYLQALADFPMHKPAIAALQFAAMGCVAAHCPRKTGLVPGTTSIT